MTKESSPRAVIHADSIAQARSLGSAILENPATATPAAEDFLAAVENAGHHEAAAIVLNALAYAARELLHSSQAMSYAERALARATSAGSRVEQARALVNRAMIAFETGAVAQARADVDAARDLGELDAAVAIAAALLANDAGDLPTAVTLLEGVLDRADLDPLMRLKALNNLGSILLATDPERALASLRAAEALVPDPQSMYGPVIMVNCAQALVYLGRLPEAMRTLQHSETAYSALTGRGLEAEWQLEVGRVFGEVRLLGEARAALDRALTGLAGDGGALIRADALVSAARLAIADGDEPSGDAFLQQAEELYRAQGRTAGAAIALVERLRLTPDPDPDLLAEQAEILTAAGLPRDAANAWLTSAAASRDRGDLASARARWARVPTIVNGDPVAALEAQARMDLLDGQHQRAAQWIASALQVVDQRAAVAAAPDLRQRISARRIRFEQLARQLTEHDAPHRQLDALLRGRPPAATPLPETAAAEQLRAHWRNLARRLTSAEEDAATLVSLSAQFVEVERALRQAQWSAVAGSPARAANGVADVAAATGTPLIAIARFADRAVAFAHARGTTRMTPLGSWSELLDDLAQLGRAIARIATGGGTPPVVAAATTLGCELGERLRPVVADLADDEAITLALDRGLESTLLSSLPPLWNRPVTIASLAVTGTPRVARDPLGSSATRVAVAVGPRLDGADAEAGDVLAVWGAGQTHRRATDVVAAFAEADVIHLAAHAGLRWDNPLQSQIHLDDGPVALTEVLAAARGRASTGRAIRLLYLAACSLGGGVTDSALVSAIPTLAEHDIETVVAATIPLPDAESGWIARTVHEAVCRGETPAAGLAQARARVRPGDPETAVTWAALACLSAYVGLA